MLVSTDIIILGAGPAGLALAGALGRRGRGTCVVERNPRLTWDRSYGAWAHDVEAHDLDGALAQSFDAPRVFTDRREFVLDAAYWRFDTSKLQSLLLERAKDAGVKVLKGEVESLEHGRERSLVSCQGGDTLAGRLVVDARGPGAEVRRRPQGPPRAYQSAYGRWLVVDSSPFEKGQMDLMDFRDVHGDAMTSFLYCMTESPGVLFAQETVLASAERVPMNVLRQRLERRLVARGITGRSTGREEVCYIPMGLGLPSRSNATLPFGAAASMVHPATGYQLARALDWAEPVSEACSSALAQGELPANVARRGIDALWTRRRRHSWALFESGLESLLSFDKQRTQQFIESFFDLPAPLWLRFMEGRMAPAEITSAMWKLFVRAPGSLRFQLLKSGTQSGPRALSHALS